MYNLSGKKEGSSMKYGFIGAGNMAGAMIRGAISHGISNQNIYVCDLDPAKAQATGAQVLENAVSVVNAADITILAVKPYVVKDVLLQIAPVLGKKALVSIAAGWTSQRLSACLEANAHILRVMPNTPLLVGEGAIALSLDNTLSKTEFEAVKAFFNMLGKVCCVHETVMDAVTGLSGSGPAFVYRFIEALADAGVMEGLTRDTAYLLAAQTVLGSAKMVLETNEHPGKLKDAVTSPAGTTIRGIYALDRCGFNGAVMQAVHEAAERSRQMASEA